MFDAPRIDALAGLALVLALVAASCGGGDTATTATDPPTTSTTTSATTVTTTTTGSTTAVSTSTEEVRFELGGFEVAGNLVLPAGGGPFAAVALVSGSGSQTRTSIPDYATLVKKFTKAGFAVLSWDKPGSGDSIGEFSGEFEITQRAQILKAATDYLRGRPEIDPTRVGAWGLSQGGWVMPRSIELFDNLDFMIVVSGGGEDSIDQIYFQASEQLKCEGLPAEQAELLEQYGPQVAKGTTYELYTEAMEVLLEVPGSSRYVGSQMAEEEEWQPWPPNIDAYFDPARVVAGTTIPVLAFFGELDRFIDPIQGSAAYLEALAAAGNDSYHVELIPGVGHTMHEQATGCAGDAMGATSARYLDLLDEWIPALTT